MRPCRRLACLRIPTQRGRRLPRPNGVDANGQIRPRWIQSSNFYSGFHSRNWATVKGYAGEASAVLAALVHYRDRLDPSAQVRLGLNAGRTVPWFRYQSSALYAHGDFAFMQGADFNIRLKQPDRLNRGFVFGEAKLWNYPRRQRLRTWAAADSKIKRQFYKHMMTHIWGEINQSTGQWRRLEDDVVAIPILHYFVAGRFWEDHGNRNADDLKAYLYDEMLAGSVLNPHIEKWLLEADEDALDGALAPFLGVSPASTPGIEADRYELPSTLQRKMQR